MPTYGDKKTRSIARSVLPSTARKSARDNKRAYHARHRAAQREANNSLLRHLTAVDEDGLLYTDIDLYDDFDEPEVFDGYDAATTVPVPYWGGMAEIVDNRRGHDKLGPLISWARATEARKMQGWGVEDKIAYFKALLPDTLQGRHALGHIESALGLYIDESYYYWYFRKPAPSYTKDHFRNDVRNLLSTTKGRRSLHTFILETVPVAAHRTPTNNRIRSFDYARDENGEIIYVEKHIPNPHIIDLRYAVRVEVYAPQMVAVTCDDCAFLRNDPLSSTEAINRFVDIVFPPGHDERFGPYRRRNNEDRHDARMAHGEPFREVYNFIYATHTFKTD